MRLLLASILAASLVTSPTTAQQPTGEQTLRELVRVMNAGDRASLGAPGAVTRLVGRSFELGQLTDAAGAYARMMSGDARFRMVLTTQ